MTRMTEPTEEEHKADARASQIAAASALGWKAEVTAARLEMEGLGNKLAARDDLLRRMREALRERSRAAHQVYHKNYLAWGSCQYAQPCSADRALIAEAERHDAYTTEVKHDVR